MLGKKILIISYVFPPSYAIGGRRWAYFSKYLQRAGYELFVVTSNQGMDKNKICPWLDAIKELKPENMTYISAKFPYHVENNSPKTVIEKIKYRLSLRKARKIVSENSVYDRFIYFADAAYRISEQMINKHEIKNIIVTGDPYHLVYKISQLKRVYGENIRLLTDIRDPWTIRGKAGEGEKKDFIETEKQLEVLELADAMFVPVEGMKSNLIEIFPQLSHKVKLLPHGYDSDIFETKKTKGNFDKWYYAGTVFSSLEVEYEILDEIVNQLGIDMNLFSFDTSKVQYSIITNPNLKKHGLVSQKDLLNITKDFGVTLYLTRFKDAFSTKFYEIIKQGIFVLYIGKKGSISDYIIENRIGYAIETNTKVNIDEEISKLRVAFENFEEKSFLANDYSFLELTKIIEKEII